MQTIDIPIWALLTLAGYQRVFKLGKQYRQRKQKQKQNGRSRNRNNSGTSGSEDIATDSKSD